MTTPEERKLRKERAEYIRDVGEPERIEVLTFQTGPTGMSRLFGLGESFRWDGDEWTVTSHEVRSGGWYIVWCQKRRNG